MDLMILLGSHSDWSVVESGLELLQTLNLDFRFHVASAHRTPAYVDSLVKEFNSCKGKVIICVAGRSAHLPGVVAAKTIKPVLAVPVSGSDLLGLDALFSTCQMPKGIPVATMGIGSSGFYNAVLFTLQILSVAHVSLEEKLKVFRHDQEVRVLDDDRAIQDRLANLSKDSSSDSSDCIG